MSPSGTDSRVHCSMAWMHVDVERPSATFAAQNSCDEEAIATKKQLQTRWLWLRPRCFVAKNRFWIRPRKMVVDVLWSRTVAARQNSICGPEQLRLAGDEFAVPTLAMSSQRKLISSRAWLADELDSRSVR